MACASHRLGNRIPDTDWAEVLSWAEAKPLRHMAFHRRVSR
ncbi:MAG: hypothetical protein ACKOBZ_01700 [Nitrospira sp.]